MRLNCIELFYALIVAIDNESRRCLRGRGGHMHVVCMQRWLAMARPPEGATDHGMATCTGRPAIARPPAKGGRPQERPVAARPPAKGGCPQRRRRRS
ncbi:hypothetical protein GW17_00030578 [Ensete ventricosum]|nr:hypothetical protein GW17_00030578 [Ensete ventricosum]